MSREIDRYTFPETGFFRKTLCVFIFLIFCLPVFSQDGKSTGEEEFDLSGYVKDLRVAYIKTIPGEDLVLDNFFHNRLNFRWRPDSAFTLAVEARTRLFYGRFVEITPDYAERIDYNDYMDLSLIWADGQSIVGHSILDRAYLEYAKSKFEARLGRQRINWGISNVWNPNDIFNAFNFFDWDYEERPGSDALRLQYHTGFASRLEISAKMGETIDDAVIAGLWKFNKWNFDVQLLGGIARGDAIGGFGWAGYIKSMGFKGELTYFKSYSSFSDTSGSVSATTMFDYSFSNGIYLQGGGLYNSLGATTYRGTNLLNFDVSAKNLSPFKYSLFLQGSYNFSPILSVNAGAIYSPGPRALTLFPGVTFSLKENWDIDLLSQIFAVGENMEIVANVLFIRLKWSF